MTAYLALAAWFFVVDLLAGRLAGAPCRPLSAALLAVVWPIGVAAALICSAILNRMQGEKLKGLMP